MPNIAYLDFYYERIATIDKLYDGALMLTALEDETVFQIAFYRKISGSTYHFDISYDYGMTWTSLDINNDGIYYLDEINEGQSIMIAGTNEYTLYGLNINTNDDNAFKVSGNIMSLLDPVSYNTITTIPYDHCFNSLFKDSNVVDASGLILPATTLDNYCYYFMFEGCTSLVNPPQLPATILAPGCYNSMFHNCRFLSTAPILPATTLASNCYAYMFDNCTSLSVAPQLPATTLTEACYAGMFYGCTALTIAPMLPATTLATQCYQSMFSGCTSLNTPPELPATTLAPGCYNGMFRYCTTLMTAPNLLATTLANQCYSYMFNGCSRLNYIRCLATTYDPEVYTVNWVQNVAPTGTFIKDTNTWWDPDYDSGVPIGWTLYNEGEEIVEYCQMTLYDDPQIGGTTIGDGTYERGWQVTCMAFPSDRYLFSGWYNGNTLISTDNPYIFNIYTDTALTAKFEEDLSIYHTVTLAQRPEIGAQLTGAGTYEENTNVTITAPIVGGYTFVGWEYDGAIVSTERSYTFTISDDMLFTATYEEYIPPVTYNVITNVNLEGAGTCTGSGIYNEDTTVTISATANEGYVFLYWLLNGQVYSTNTIETFNISSNMNFTAVFEIVQDYTSQYLTIESLENNNQLRIYLNEYIQDFTATIEYNINGGSWKTVTLYPGYNTIRYINNGDVVRFRKYTLDFYFSNGYDFYMTITPTKTYKAYGNILSLYAYHLDEANSNETYFEGYNFDELITSQSIIVDYYTHLFYYSPIVDVSNLILGALTLKPRCYELMFAGCASLVNAPVLYATTLASECYSNMFAYCSSLVNAPALPATTLVPSCYAGMFEFCTSIISTPVLPNISIAPEACYQEMFGGCTSLVNVSVLPATTLNYACYDRMFVGCTSLTTAPVLPATTLAVECYNSMFWGCTLLNNVTCLATDISALNCTRGWLSDVSETGTFTKAASMSEWLRNENGIPEDWTVQDAE